MFTPEATGRQSLKILGLKILSFKLKPKKMKTNTATSKEESVDTFMFVACIRFSRFEM